MCHTVRMRYFVDAHVRTMRTECVFVNLCEQKCECVCDSVEGEEGIATERESVRVRFTVCGSQGVRR